MKSIILYNQGGYSPELLAFNGETNFAILYYACTIKPYVLATFTTIRICAVLQQAMEEKNDGLSFTTIRICAVLQLVWYGNINLLAFTTIRICAVLQLRF